MRFSVRAQLSGIYYINYELLSSYQRDQNSQGGGEYFRQIRIGVCRQGSQTLPYLRVESRELIPF